MTLCTFLTFYIDLGLLTLYAPETGNFRELIMLYSHSVSVTKTSQLMLYREIIAVCSKIHTKHINTLCGQNVEWLNVKLVVPIATAGL